MKAIIYTRYGPPHVLELKEVEKPAPGDNEVLIRIYAAAVSATDPIFRKGKPFISRSATGFIKPKNAILGDALAGEIEAVGKDVKLFKKGDQVFGSSGSGLGAHAQYKCLPEDGALAIKPANMNYQEAAAVGDGALTALPFLRDTANIQSGQKVLINGASGSIGTFAVQLARYFGAEVTGVCSTVNLELVTSLGAEKVIDYTKEDFTNSRQTYDIIFDLAGKTTFSECKNSLRQNGKFLQAAITLSIFPSVFWTSMVGTKKALIMATGLRPPVERTKDLNFIVELLRKGKIKPVIDRKYPLEQIAEAHSYVDTGHKKGNVVITLGNEIKN